MRWRLRLSELLFQVKNKKGSTNVHADALSGLETLFQTQITIDDDIPCLMIDTSGTENQETSDTPIDYVDDTEYAVCILVGQATETDSSQQLERL